jgi:hypothetical protein
VDATIAYALNRQGGCGPRFTAMRRAYPQFMAEGGEALPREILTVIFPIDYWELIQTHALAEAARSVPDRRARGAGVDVPGGHPLVGRCVGPDADHSGHGPRYANSIGNQAVFRPGG